jgi:DNA-binding response OmpR family regulator
MKKKIIIAEDDNDLLFMLVMMLQERGYEVLGLKDGSLIMEGHCELPDLFILDKHMDYYDGLAITKQLKNQQSSQSIPVMMISGTENKDEANAAGIDLFFSKPIDTSKLFYCIDSILRSPEIEPVAR